MKSFATSICPIKNPLAVNMRHPRAIPAPSQPGKSVFYRMLADSGPFSWTSRCSLGAPVGLRHGDLAYRCFRAISACRTIQLSLSNRPLTGPRPVFATATLLTGTSVPSPCGETVIHRPFGAVTLPTGISEASPRGGPSPNRFQTGLFPML